MSDPKTRAAVLQAGKTWLDTPYQHQASTRGAGTDCLGLIRGIWRELYGYEPETPPAYTPDWAEQNGRETLYEAARRCLTPIANETAQAGDVLLFRMHNSAPCKHIGILSTPERPVLLSLPRPARFRVSLITAFLKVRALIVFTCKPRVTAHQCRGFTGVFASRGR